MSRQLDKLCIVKNNHCVTDKNYIVSSFQV